MRPRKWKRSLAVIEGRRGPSHCGVARRTSRRYARLSVRRIGCPVEVFYVAAKAIRRCSLVFPADMAGEAIQRGVCTRQRITRELQVIKLGAQPAIHRVAYLAICGEIQRRVAWICSLLEICQMAGITIRGKPLKLSDRRALVAGLAIHRRMSSN